MWITIKLHLILDRKKGGEKMALVKPIYDNETYVELYASESMAAVKKKCHVCGAWVTIPKGASFVICNCTTKVYR